MTYQVRLMVNMSLGVIPRVDYMHAMHLQGFSDTSTSASLA